MSEPYFYRELGMPTMALGIGSQYWRVAYFKMPVGSRSHQNLFDPMRDKGATRTRGISLTTQKSGCGKSHRYRETRLRSLMDRFPDCRQTGSDRRARLTWRFCARRLSGKLTVPLSRFTRTFWVTIWVKSNRYFPSHEVPFGTSGTCWPEKPIKTLGVW